jgi:aspartokinase/homoserine dehydrogenase 1
VLSAAGANRRRRPLSKALHGAAYSIKVKESKWQVYKFGGTSLGEPGRLPLVLGLIETCLGREGRLAIVVSALGETTDWLFAAIRAAERGEIESALAEIGRARRIAMGIAEAVLPDSAVEAFGREVKLTFAPAEANLGSIAQTRMCSLAQRDSVLAIGEVVSTMLLASVLRAREIEAYAVDARDFMVADGEAEAPRIEWTATLQKFVSAASCWTEGIPVVTGFIALTHGGQTTTLGRNGSDYTAALIAELLQADSVTVWTDVPGVMTADPLLVLEAVPVERLSYDEALELAYFGTRMFHPRTIIPLRERGIPLYIRSTVGPDAPGTRIDAQGNPNPSRPTCVTSLEGLSLLSVRSRRAELGRPIAGRLVSLLAASSVRVWLSSESTLGQCFSVVVPNADEAQAMNLMLMELLPEIGRHDLILAAPLSPVAMVTLVGQAVGVWPNVAGRFLGSIGRAGVPVRAISQGASQRSISCVVDGEDTVVAVRTVHAAFNFAHAEISAFVLGKGTVGRNFLEQLHRQDGALRAHHDVHVRLVGLASGSGAIFDAGGLDASTATEGLIAAISTGHASGEARAHLAALGRLPNPVVVDCTAAERMEDLYAEAFSLGIDVVSANKKPLSLPQSRYDLLKSTARLHHRSYHYGTTVGAALPIIETLKNLIRTGDKVTLIEGAFSGTLGFLCERVSMGEPLSAAVRRARELGFTEPHPRDDLSGLDVARKALILARELGLQVDLADVLLHPFVTVASPLDGDVERFMASLEGVDASVASHVSSLQKRGRLFRYLARIEPETNKVTVGPADVDVTHPAAALRGTESFVAFYTERYREYPLTVRGAGAGGEVTASGVLADILKLAQNLRGGA